MCPGGFEPSTHGLEGRCSIQLSYGHTHRPVVEEEDGILVINPGSLTFPRQQGRRPSYAVMDVEEGKDLQVEIKYL